MAIDFYLEDKISEEVNLLLRTLLRKNHDYGSSVFLPNVFKTELNPQDAIAVRASDKIRRLQNLLNLKEQGEVSESIDDSLLDLAGYCIMWRIARYNQLS